MFKKHCCCKYPYNSDLLINQSKRNSFISVATEQNKDIEIVIYPSLLKLKLIIESLIFPKIKAAYSEKKIKKINKFKYEK